MDKNKVKKLNCENKREMEKKEMRKLDKRVFKNIGGELDYEEAMGRITNNIEVAKENISDILKVFLELCGFKTPSLQDKMFSSFIEELCTSSYIDKWAKCLELKDERIVKQMDNIAIGFDYVMNADDREIRSFNNRSSEDDKRSLFTQCLTYILYLLKTEGVNGLAFLLKIASESENELEKERLWSLSTMIMIPTVAA